MTPWYATFFDHLYRQLHRDYEHEATPHESSGTLRFLDLPPGASILDVPCGTGRHAVEFAAAGLRVTGVDLSEETLALARRRALQAGVEVEWVCRDMRDLPWQGRFNGVACLFHSFGYLGQEGDAQALAAMVRALKPGGRLLLDLPNRDYYVDSVPPSFWQETGSHWVLCSFRFDPLEGVAHTDYILVPKGGGEPETRVSSVRWYTLPELRGLLAAAGAALEEVYGEWDGRPVTGDAPKLIALARRREGRSCR